MEYVARKLSKAMIPYAFPNMSILLEVEPSDFISIQNEIFASPFILDKPLFEPSKFSYIIEGIKFVVKPKKYA